MDNEIAKRKKESAEELDFNSVMKSIFVLGIRFMIYAVLLAGLSAGMLWGVGSLGPSFYAETGPVEIMQIGFALLAALLFLLSARLDKTRTSCAIILTGLFLCFFIREMDHFLDLFVCKHAWKVGVTLVLVLTGFYVWRNQEKVYRSVSAFVRHPSFGVFISGFLILIVFSRIFGMDDFWEAILLDKAYWTVKDVVVENTDQVLCVQLWGKKCHMITRIIEESLEQLGYFLMFVSSFEYLYDAQRSRKRTE